MRLAPLVTFAAILAGAPTPKSATGAQRPVLAILDTIAQGTPDALAATLTESLASTAANTLEIETIAQSDVRRLVQLEQLKQLTGCDDACGPATNLGGTLGASQLLSSSLGRLGDRLQISLALIDVATGKVTRRGAREASNESALSDVARDLLYFVVNGDERPKSAARLAVLYFDNGATPALDPLRKGLADMLISDLSRAPRLQIVERSRLEAILSEQKLQKSKAFDPSTAQRVGKLLGAEFLVLGSYFEFLGTLRIDARIVRVETGAVEKAAAVNGKADDFLELEQKLAAALEAGVAEKLGLDVVKPATRPATREADLAGALEYAKVLELFDAGKRDDARKALAKLAKDRPQFVAAQRLQKVKG